MGEIIDALRAARRREAGTRESRFPRMLPFRGLDEAATWPAEDAMGARPYRVITIASNKGGVGKTTIASNLPVFLGALREDLPILVIGLDDQSLIDRMFELEPAHGARGVVEGLRSGSFRSQLRMGQYGVHYVPSSDHFEDLDAAVSHTGQLRATLDATGWEGLVVLDTKSDLGLLTRNAIAASDLVVIPVADDPSLREADKLFELMELSGMPRERGRVLLSMIDRRIKYRECQEQDILGLLVSRIRERGYPLLESFLSRSPKVESLTTNPDGRAHSMLAAAPGSIVTLQMRHVADELLKWLDRVPVSAPGGGIFDDAGAREVDLVQRLETSVALGQAGDSRFGGLAPDVLRFSSEENALGRYPVTVWEYSRFVDSGGYDNDRFWTFDDAMVLDRFEWRRPNAWSVQLEDLSRPVTGVSWYEAAAYCRWLSFETRLAVRLATSAEWVRCAATSGGAFPWGNEAPDALRANFGDLVGGPSPVGLFPAGRTGQGHLDMAGNVWEWCTWDSSQVESTRPVKGGCFSSPRENLRTEYYNAREPSERSPAVGFRILARV